MSRKEEPTPEITQQGNLKISVYRPEGITGFQEVNNYDHYANVTVGLKAQTEITGPGLGELIIFQKLMVGILGLDTIPNGHSSSMVTLHNRKGETAATLEYLGSEIFGELYQMIQGRRQQYGSLEMLHALDQHLLARTYYQNPWNANDQSAQRVLALGAECHDVTLKGFYTLGQTGKEKPSSYEYSCGDKKHSYQAKTVIPMIILYQDQSIDPDQQPLLHFTLLAEGVDNVIRQHIVFTPKYPEYASWHPGLNGDEQHLIIDLFLSTLEQMMMSRNSIQIEYEIDGQKYRLNELLDLYFKGESDQVSKYFSHEHSSSLGRAEILKEWIMYLHDTSSFQQNVK